jgi:hypothetical protein
VDDYAGALRHHQRQQPPVEPHGGQQVAVQRLLPLVVREGSEAAARGRCPADVVDQDVDAAEALPHKADDLLRPLGCAEVGGHEPLRLPQALGGGLRGGDHRGARPAEAVHDSCADAAGAAGHERTFADEFGVGERAHRCLSPGTPVGRRTIAYLDMLLHHLPNSHTGGVDLLFRWGR